MADQRRTISAKDTELLDALKGLTLHIAWRAELLPAAEAAQIIADGVADLVKGISSPLSMQVLSARFTVMVHERMQR